MGLCVCVRPPSPVPHTGQRTHEQTSSHDNDMQTPNNWASPPAHPGQHTHQQMYWLAHADHVQDGLWYHAIVSGFVALASSWRCGTAPHSLNHRYTHVSSLVVVVLLLDVVLLDDCGHRDVVKREDRQLHLVEAHHPRVQEPVGVLLRAVLH